MSRGEVLTRAVAFVWLMTAGWLITVIAGILAIPFGIVDLAVTAIRGEGLDTDGRVFGFVIRSIHWNAEQFVYVIAGKGELELTP